MDISFNTGNNTYAGMTCQTCGRKQNGRRKSRPNFSVFFSLQDWTNAEKNSLNSYNTS